MGYRELEFTIPVTASDQDIETLIKKKCHISSGDYSWHLLRKSLDARKRNNIVWKIRVAVISRTIKGGEKPVRQVLTIPSAPTSFTVAVIGSGPAGIFAATVLSEAGASVSLFERGKPVVERIAAIEQFEQQALFDPAANYAFGEGGAGTFSDGKLTSRSKHISAERNYITEHYIAAGAPEEIRWLTHPHIGSDNLRTIAINMRKDLIKQGVTFHFSAHVTNLKRDLNRYIVTVNQEKEYGPFDAVIVATGHSAYDTHRMLMRLGVPFRPKPFAIGVRVEHPQELINRGRWHAPTLPGVKAADYRMTFSSKQGDSVYTFCMCPGGKIVPAAAFPERNIVNGMSMYARDGFFANSAVVSAVHPTQLTADQSAETMIGLLDALEHDMFRRMNGYAAPTNTISAFLNEKIAKTIPESSYPFPLTPFDFDSFLPAGIAKKIRAALANFSQKIPRFNEGIIVGLETKTSAPIQVLRDTSGTIPGLPHLMVCGEGSGWSGGIISSAADGIKSAITLLHTVRHPH